MVGRAHMWKLYQVNRCACLSTVFRWPRRGASDGCREACSWCLGLQGQACFSGVARTTFAQESREYSDEVIPQEVRSFSTLGQLTTKPIERTSRCPLYSTAHGVVPPMNCAPTKPVPYAAIVFPITVEPLLLRAPFQFAESVKKVNDDSRCSYS